MFCMFYSRECCYDYDYYYLALLQQIFLLCVLPLVAELNEINQSSTFSHLEGMSSTLFLYRRLKDTASIAKMKRYHQAH